MGHPYFKRRPKLRAEYVVLSVGIVCLTIFSFSSVHHNDTRSALVNMGMALHLSSYIPILDGRPYYKALGTRLWWTTAAIVLYTLHIVK